jgi:hypothetical protein
MSQEPTPGSLAWLLRLSQDAIYGAVGLAVTTSENVPHLVERGREEVNNRLRAPRMIGSLIISQAERQLRGRLRPVFGPRPAGPGPRQTRAPAGIPDGHDEHGLAAPKAEPQTMRSPTSAAPLAIPEYDSLSASQVVRRLAGLNPEELAEVAEYESATRGRRTILARIAQLQGGPPPSYPSG